MKAFGERGAIALMAVALTSTTALAADVFVMPEQEVIRSGLGYRVGLAIGAVHNTDGGWGVESNGGAAEDATRFAGFGDIAVGYEFTPNWGVQGDLVGALIDATDRGDSGDWTRAYGHAAGHAYYRFDNFLVGGFGGYGRHEDDGDSDERMSYWFAGAEGKMFTSWGSVFGQAGYLDSEDEYDEGTQEAPFARLGMNYFVSDNWSVSADGAIALGNKYGDDDYNNRILDFGVGTEYRLASMPISVFGRYEFTQVSYKEDGDDDRYGDNFHTVMAGVRFRFGDTLREADRAPGSLDLPSFGKWVAFNANEVE